MEVKLRGLDRYEVEAIQYDGTNSDEICQFILEHKPYTQIEGAFLNKGTDKKMMAVIVIPSGEDILVREKEWLVHVEVPYGNQNSFYVMTDEERQDRFQEVNEDDLFPWIKVEDAKPKEEQVVIVLYRKYGDLQVARHCFYKDSSLVNGKWIHANSIVIAWLLNLNLRTYDSRGYNTGHEYSHWGNPCGSYCTRFIVRRNIR